MTQFASRAVGDRILDHEFRDSIGDYWGHGGCMAMVMRNGGGDQCGHPYDAHPKPWVWHGERFSTADPAGQDFDFHPTFSPEPTHSPVNTILAALNAEIRRDLMLPDLLVMLWHSALLDFELFGGYAGWNRTTHPYHVILTATDEERDHALHVLERYERIAALNLEGSA